MHIKPKVLIMIATDQISGPAKGVLQFLENAPAGAFDYVLCGFEVTNRPVGQFVQEARRRNLNLRVLKQRFPFDPDLILQARHLIRENGINIVQTHGYKSNTIGHFLRTSGRLPWIGFAHGYIDDNWKNRFYNRIDRLALRRADRIVAVSKAMKELLVGHGIAGKAIRVVHNAVDPREAEPDTPASTIRQRYGLTSEQKVIGVVGRLSPEKGQLIFLKAMEETVRKFPRVKALIIGDGQDRAMLEGFCREKGLSDHVVFLGHQERIANYYQVLDLFVLPSLSEGSPNAVLEAMSFAIPVLATAVGGVPEIIQEGNGAMVPSNDSGMLAKKMIELLADDALRSAIGLKGKSSLFAGFTAAGRVKQIVDLYEELLSDQSRTQSTYSSAW